MDRKKGWLFRLLSLTVVAALVFQIITIINPMNLENSVTSGVCKVTSLSWAQGECDRAENDNHLYSVPQISGEFVKVSGKPTVVRGTTFSFNETVELFNFDHLSVDRLNVDDINGKGPNKKAFLFDDLSDNPLINCSDSTFVSTKKRLVSFLPHFNESMNTTSTTNNYPFQYPAVYFNCSHDTLRDVTYMSFQKFDKLFLLPFFANLAALILCLFLVQKYDVDGPAKDLASFVLQIVYLIIFAVNFIFYVVYVLIGHVICNMDIIDPETFLRRGSIFFPFVWFYKKCKKGCTTSTPESPATISEVTSVQPALTAEMPAFVRRNSAPELNTRPHAPPITPTYPHRLPAASTNSRPLRPQTSQLSPPSYADHCKEDDEIAPPSYDDVIKNYTHYL